MASTTTGSRPLPPLPEIGQPEMYYAKGIKRADNEGDTHLHAAYKVGQYVTLALDPNAEWEQKLKYFRHALSKHCSPPPMASDDVWQFYKAMADMVKRHAGAEALGLACAEDDIYATRKQLGQDEEQIADDAEQFFTKLMGVGADQCPDHFVEEDWAQLRMIRDVWI